MIRYFFSFLLFFVLTACSSDPDQIYINLDKVPSKPQFYWQPHTKQMAKQELQEELYDAKDYADELRILREQEDHAICAE